MRVTGPTLRRRNHAWLQMRSLDRRAARLARRQQQNDDASDDADVSDDESADESADDSDSDTEPATASPPPAASATVRPSTWRTAAPLPTPTAGVSAGVALAVGEPDVQPDIDGVEPGGEESDGMESDGEESADESTAPPSNVTQPPGDQPTPPPPTVTSGLGNPNFAAPLPPPPSVTSVTGLNPTAMSTLPLTSGASATSGPSPSLPATGNAQAEVDKSIPPGRQANEQEADGLSIGQAPDNKLSGGAVAGIVVGVLLFVGLLAGAALLWRKWRRDRGLPFFPQKRYKLEEDEPRGPDSFAGGAIGGKSNAPVRTNTQIMDDLMKAAYAADNGTNDMEGPFAPAAVPKVPPQLPLNQQQQQQATVGAFMDEKAYVALAGPPTPGSPKKPVMRWLDEVKTPTQPNGPEIPPTPQMPLSPEIARLPAGGKRMPEPPRPAYWGRDTMTTNTTNTSVRWYG